MARNIGISAAVIFAAPAAVTGAYTNGLIFILPGYLATEYGYSLALTGLVLLVARIFDAVTDPLIGALADRHAARGGDLRIWVAVGAVSAAAAGAPLLIGWIPGAFFPLLLAFALFFFAYTVLEVPHNAWATTLSRDPAERSLLFTAKGVVFMLGTIAFMVSPYLVKGSEGAGFSPESMRVAAFAGLIIAVITAFLVIMRGRRSPPPVTAKTLRKARPGAPGAWRSLLAWPFVAFSLAFVVLALGLGLWSGALFVVLASYFQLGDRAPLIFAVGTPLILVALPIWYVIVRLLGLKRSWVLGVTIAGAALLASGFLPPSPEMFPVLVALVLVYYATVPVMTVVAPAILANVIDHAKLTRGVEVAGLMFSAYSFITKFAASVATGAGLSALALFGFDAQSVEQSDAARLGVALVFGVAPAAGLFGSGLLMALHPLGPRRMAIVRKRLSDLEQRRM